MKILQINTFVNSRSHGRITEEIGKVLMDNGHESYIAYGRGNQNNSSSNLIKIGNQKDIYQHGLETRLFDNHGLGSRNATQEFVEVLSKLKPDAIGLHNIHGYYINYKILFKCIKQNNIPVIWTFHDCWPFTGHCAYFEAVDCQKWETHCNNCPLSNKYPLAFRDRSYQNFEDKKSAFLNVKNLKIITPSLWLSKYVKKSFLKEYPVEVINNGIDIDVFKPYKGHQNRNETLILGVASKWDDRKGLYDFIEIRKRLPESYKIVLLGLSTKQILGLPKGIEGHLRTENTGTLVEWYNKADVFVNPTYIDNFPTTNIESLACGTPVITYDTGGSPESVDNASGFIVPKGDFKQIAKIIKNNIKTFKKNHSSECRERAIRYFNKDVMFKKYSNIFESF